jgi:hypothetical protein
MKTFTNVDFDKLGMIYMGAKTGHFQAAINYKAESLFLLTLNTH